MGIAGIGILAFLSFQYAIITHVPTGGDPAIHIYNMRHATYLGLFKSQYPLPLIIYKWFASVDHLGYSRVFTLTISAFLLFSSLSLGLFIRRLTNSWTAAFIGSSIFAVGGWVTDGLRMGLLAETFGWGMLFLALYFLADKKLVLTVIFSGLLLLSHPFSFLVFVLCCAMYLIVGLIEKEPKQRKFCLYLSLVYLICLTIAFFIIKAGRIDTALQFVNPERPEWGIQKLGDILTIGGPRRLMVAVLAVIGIVASAKDWQKPFVKISYLLAGVGLFMSFNHLFGIYFLVFRFFPYLEAVVAIFAVLGLIKAVEGFNIKNMIYCNILMLCLGAFVVFFGVRSSDAITSYQANTVSANDRITQGDVNAFAWINSNISPSSFVTAHDKRAIWAKALTNVNKIDDDSVLYGQSSMKDCLTVGCRPTDYIYYSELDNVPASIDDYYTKVYDNGGVKIYKKK